MISALALLKEPCAVELWSDSKYVIDGLGKGWAKGWQSGAGSNPTRSPPEPGPVGAAAGLCEVHHMTYHWVKGHAENPYNNRCDELAVAESQKYK